MAFVGSLYAMPGGDMKHTHRDAPSEVRRRLAAVTIAAGLCVAALGLFRRPEADDMSLLHLIGADLDADALRTSAAALALGATLFLGPLVQWFVDAERESIWQVLVGVRHWPLSTWRSVLLAPALEEVVFRACLCTALRLGPRLSPGVCVFWSSLLFSIAHAHHVIHHINVDQIGFDRAVAIVALQCSYTLVFGIISGLLYCASGRLWPVVVLHW